MKIVCSKSDLIEAISVVSRVVKGNINPPILTNILIDASGDTVVFRGYDMETGIECCVNDAQIEDTGRVAVSAKMLGDIVRKMSDEDISFESEKEGTSIVIRAGKTKMKLSCQSAEDFPVFPTVENPKTVTIKSELLRTVLSKVQFAVSKDNTRAVLTGVYLRCSENVLTGVAIDGYRMGIRSASVEGTSEDFSIIIPSKSVTEILKAIGNADDGETVVTLGVNQVYFDIEGIKIVSRIISGQYIDYEKIITKSCKTQIVINADEFSEAIDRACLIANAESSSRVPTTFNLKDNSLTITCSSSSSSSQDIINDVDIKGEAVDIDVNGFYIADLLKVIDDDQISVEFSGGQGPVIFKPVDNESFLYLVLPIRR